MTTLSWDDIVPHLTGLAHMATADADGAPHVCRVAPAHVNGNLCFFTTWSSKKARNLRANPRASIVLTPMAEVYLTGTVELIDDAGAKEQLWSSGVLGYDPAAFFQSPRNPDLVLGKFVPTSAVVYIQEGDAPGRRIWRR